MGEHFLGSCTFASRNSLIHNGATNGTKLGRFEHEGGSRARSQGLGGYVEEPFATVNFAEFVFLGTGVKIASVAALFSWLRGGPARIMDHLGE
jgi:hypothetical protein